MSRDRCRHRVVGVIVELTLTLALFVAVHPPRVTLTLRVTGEAPLGEKVIAFVPVPAVIAPPPIVHA